jgi:hypothetical protein
LPGKFKPGEHRYKQAPVELHFFYFVSLSMKEEKEKQAFVGAHM